jgi:hypothetical protein
MIQPDGKCCWKPSEAIAEALFGALFVIDLPLATSETFIPAHVYSTDPLAAPLNV